MLWMMSCLVSALLFAVFMNAAIPIAAVLAVSLIISYLDIYSSAAYVP